MGFLLLPISLSIGCDDAEELADVPGAGAGGGGASGASGKGGGAGLGGASGASGASGKGGTAGLGGASGASGASGKGGGAGVGGASGASGASGKGGGAGAGASGAAGASGKGGGAGVGGASGAAGATGGASGAAGNAAGSGGASGAGVGGAAGVAGAAGAAAGAAGVAGAAGAAGVAGAAGGNAGMAGASGMSGMGGTGGNGGSPIGPAPVLLGAAESYVILAQAAVSNVPTSAITGNVGLSPAAATYITGFPLTNVGAYWTTPEVTGQLFAADGDPPTPSNLTTAIGAMMAAYTDAAGRPTPDFVNLGGGDIGGLKLTPGLYTWGSSVTLPADVVIDGGPDDTWIFQITGDVVVSAGKSITLTGGARAKNIVWQTAGMVDVGTGAHVEGIVLSKTAITMGTGASIVGRLYAQTMIAIDSSTVTQPAP